MEEEAGDWEASCRLILIGKKWMPATADEKYWATVTNVSEYAFSELFISGMVPGASAAAGPPSAIVVGVGVYALTRKGDSARSGALSYVLSEPASPGDALAEVGIVEPAGRFELVFKNPSKGRASKPDFSDAALASFDDRARIGFGACPDSLNTERAELIVIPTGDSLDVTDAVLEASLTAAAEADHEERMERVGGGNTALTDALSEELDADRLGLDVWPAAVGSFA